MNSQVNVNIQKNEMQNFENLKFEGEFSSEYNKKIKNEEKKAIIENVKEKIIKRSNKPKNIIRNYGIKDDNDPSAIKKLYDN